MEQLTLSEEQEKELNGSSNSFKREIVSEVTPTVYSVAEASTRGRLADALFKTDMNLTKKQLHLPEISGGRPKRQ
ncbi:hypothetical protein OSTOST_25804, partial [Ostertagia ostertagi]